MMGFLNCTSQEAQQFHPIVCGLAASEQHIIRECHMQPTVEEVMGESERADVSSILDGASAVHQLPLSDKSRQ